MKKLREKKLVILVSLLVVFLIILFAIITAVNITHYGKVDEKAHCDVAIVLGAATSNGEVSPVYRERINHGIWLYENGFVDYIGVPYPEGNINASLQIGFQMNDIREVLFEGYRSEEFRPFELMLKLAETRYLGSEESNTEE